MIIDSIELCAACHAEWRGFEPRPSRHFDQRVSARGKDRTMSQAIIIFAAITLAGTAQAQQSTFTNSNGRYSGAAVTHGNSTSFTDQRGNFAGSAITRGNKTDYY